MNILWWKQRRKAPDVGMPPEEALRQKYRNLRELLAYNNDTLELMACLQQDLQYIPPRRDVVGMRVTSIFEKAARIVGSLEKLTGRAYPVLSSEVEAQRLEVERYVAGLQERPTPRLSASLAELTAGSSPEAGGKAALLGEVKNHLGLPVPPGYVLTTEAYRQFCGIPLWRPVRDELRDIEIEDLEELREVSGRLTEMVMDQPVPRAVEVALTERARWLAEDGVSLAVRSSSVGEGGEAGGRTYAGQFLTLLNVPAAEVVQAYKRVVAGRFSERALFYRLSTGLSEVDSPMAVLVLPMIRARASGILYSRDPADPKSKSLWITASHGLGLEIASGRMPADLFVVSRSAPHAVVDRQIVHKTDQLVALEGGGLTHSAIAAAEADEPSLGAGDLATLAAWGVRLEQHFGVAQDVEWVQDADGKLWIVQTRPLALVDPAAAKGKAKAKGEPLLAGGRTIYPGRVSGPAYRVEDLKAFSKPPEGAIVFVRRPSPELVGVFARIGGLVADWGNVAGHVAALLREFKVPSVFLMAGAFDRIKTGDPVSLDAVHARLYPGSLWPLRVVEMPSTERYRDRTGDPISQRLLTLNLLDPSAMNFRPSGCRSTHDVIRFCHERAVEAMFTVNDLVVEQASGSALKLKSTVPVDVHVLDLGGGIAPDCRGLRTARPEQITSRPFQSLWKGLSHPEVTWIRQMPATMMDLASVMARSLTPSGGSTRMLGEKSYLLVADEYLNFNSRLAYHFALVDACLSDSPSKNYIAFRFAGGGATWRRRSLRACFIELCLSHYGFHADRRGDLINAWYMRASAEDTDARLDILGRLMASTCQLDMYMQSYDVMKWYVEQFIAGNYSFRAVETAS